MSNQQTVLRVQTNYTTGVTIPGTATIVINNDNVGTLVYNGNGTVSKPYQGTLQSTTDINTSFSFTCNGGTGTFYYNISTPTPTIYTPNFRDNLDIDYVNIFVENEFGLYSGNDGITAYRTPTLQSTIKLNDGDKIVITHKDGLNLLNFSCYFIADFVQANIPPANYLFLDLNSDIPIKINRSYAELQDISKKNSDLSIGLTVPGTKKNNKFFENFFNTDQQTLFFDATARIPCDVLINDEIVFNGFIRLNKVSVKNNQIEYDITLYSVLGDLFGKIGNGLLKDLNFDDPNYHFNHWFNVWNITTAWDKENLLSINSVPNLFFYPIIHNGYEYSGDTVNFSGIPDTITRLYTSTKVGSWTSYSAAQSAGVLENRINSPKNAILDNQLKPALNIWGLINLMFKQYGYTIKSEFFNTPWFKLLYTYGFYSSDSTKFGYKIPTPQYEDISNVEVIVNETSIPTTEYVCNDYYTKQYNTINFTLVQKGTGIPCYCTSNVVITINLDTINYCNNQNTPYSETITIMPGNYSNGYSYQQTDYVTNCGGQNCNIQYIITTNLGIDTNNTNAPISPRTITSYPALPANTQQLYEENDYIDFALAIDPVYKQIDLLSSIAKKFNLVLIPNKDNPNEIIIEPFSYWVGTGKVYDWTDKLSFDYGFTVEPALNYIESQITLTDLDDGDEGNKIFKNSNNRTYGLNYVYNTTNFKSQEKKIETIFSPEIIRTWDDNIKLPLGINYSTTNNSTSNGSSESVAWQYKGIKSKPKLFFNLGNYLPFFNNPDQQYDFTTGNINTSVITITTSKDTDPMGSGSNVSPLYYSTIPSVSHTMPMGNNDANKINNDSICILFHSEQPEDFGLGISTYNAYTINHAYNLFYFNRVNNLFDKNTRFLSGKFKLELSDYKNLQANDLIKINNQYFIWNQIKGFNLSHRELTDVELVQYNNSYQLYPTRYFTYQYEGDSTIYKFQTYFNPINNPAVTYTLLGERNDSIRRTYFYWSCLYDYFIGCLGGNVSSYVTTYVVPVDAGNGYIYPGRVVYQIQEVSQDVYNSGGLDHTLDPNNQYFIDSYVNGQY